MRRLRTVLLGAFVGLCVLPAGAAASRPTVWCHWAPADANDRTPEGLANAKLCSGDANGARLAYAAEFASVKARLGTTHQSDPPTWSEYAPNAFYAMIASHHDDEAERFLDTQIVHDRTRLVTSAERSFFAGHYADAFAADVADDATIFRTPDNQAAHRIDPHLTAALAALRANDLDGAIARMRENADRGSLYDLMRGDLAAQRHDWASAFGEWIDAVRDTSDVDPFYCHLDDCDPFDDGDGADVRALEMIFYYRAHAPVTPPAGYPPK